LVVKRIFSLQSFYFFDRMGRMNITLDQWEALQAVVQLGGLARAAAHLNRSQSTVSYALNRLQQQIGIRLFELVGRRARINETGRALLADVDPLLGGFKSLEERARSLASGCEPEICLAADSVYPNERLFSALAEFARLHPHVRLKLFQDAFISTTDAFMTHGAHLCITTGPMLRDYFSQPILTIRFLAVARADHPLHQTRCQLKRADLIQHRAMIIEGPEGPTARSQPRTHSQRYFLVNALEAGIEAVRSGLCFGWLPTYRIQPYLSSGELVRLRLPTGGARRGTIYLVLYDVGATGQGITALASLLGANRRPEVI
jgi:DNA-binding transcriptional LysR family regulator